MEAQTCSDCRKPKASQTCGVCEEAFCKKCSEMVSPGDFSFLSKTPEILTRKIYCHACYDREVLPEKERYDEILARAKMVFVFFKTQRKQIPLIRKSKIPIVVETCDDRDETILRLGFLAAEQNHNAIIEVDVNSKKLRNEGYQTSTWSGTAFPADVDGNKVERDDQLERIYR
jgi:hypothetical protein